jgi:hypothetical protein
MKKNRARRPDLDEIDAEAGGVVGAGSAAVRSPAPGVETTGGIIL